MTIKVFNLTTGDDLFFSDEADPKFAVAYGHCEENKLLSSLFHNLFADTLDEFYKTLPFSHGKRSIACGDWACVIKEQA